MKQIFTYNGNDIFGDLNFGLYGYDDIDFVESKNNIMDNFKGEYQDKLIEVLDRYGMKFMKLKWFSPREYNFKTDSIDLELKIVDKDKLIGAVEKNADDIRLALAKNKSYDGYMKLTSDSVEEVIEDIRKGEGIDIIALSVLLRDIDFSDFEMAEYLILDETEDSDRDMVDYVGVPR